MGTARGSGEHGRSPFAHKEKLVMSYDPPRQQDVASGPPVDQGAPGAARAANLLVLVTVVVLLIGLAVVVMLA
jgi:hypothetical protein